MSQQKSMIEVAGKDVDAAIAAGLARLDLPRDAVEVEVLDEGRQGMFGLGARAARVRLKVTSSKELERQSPAQSKPKPESKPKPRPKPKPETPVAPPAPPSEAEAPVSEREPPPEVEPEAAALTDEEDKAHVAQAVTRGLLDAMGLDDTQIAVERAEPGPSSEEEVPPLVVDVSGPGADILIGPDGEVLNAFQHLVRLLVGRKMKGWVHVVVDVQGYKAQRAERLRDLAHRMADQAVDTDRTVILQPMPPHERRVVHVALYDDSRVTTESIYEGERRRVTIVPEE
jgi:spoIIIJ-associated protein